MPMLPPTPLQSVLYCGGCGYDLRATIETRCPECGQEFDPARRLGQCVPWEQRRFVGCVRGYLGTIWQTVVRTPALVEAAGRPMDPYAARHFRRITTSLLALGAPTATLVLLRRGAVAPGLLPSETLPYLPYYLVGSTVAMMMTALGVALGAWALTSITSAVFHDARGDVVQQNRLFALGCYASAPLVLLPLAGGVAVLDEPPDVVLEIVFNLGLIGLMLLSVLVWILSPLHLWRHAPRRLVVWAVFVPAGATLMLVSVVAHEPSRWVLYGPIVVGAVVWHLASLILLRRYGVGRAGTWLLRGMCLVTLCGGLVLSSLAVDHPEFLWLAGMLTAVGLTAWVGCTVYLLVKTISWRRAVLGGLALVISLVLVPVVLVGLLHLAATLAVLIYAVLSW